jgi:predicted nuclease of predicted toxin-antitoxin system
MSVKLLLDTCVWGKAKTELAAAGIDVVWIGDRSPDPGDEAILAEAVRDQRILVTLDRDFGELAIVKSLPHSGIVRLVGIAAKQQAAVCLHVLSKHNAELLAGAIVTVEPGRVRIRPADRNDDNA